MDLRERFIETNGIKLHVMESGPADKIDELAKHVFTDTEQMKKAEAMTFKVALKFLPDMQEFQGNLMP